jgi:hypothetical protein
MDDNTTPNAAPVAEQTPNNASIPSDDIETKAAGSSDDPLADFDGFEDGDDNAEGEEGLQAQAEEVEYEGKKYKLPKELKDALLRHSDYTRKTQEVSASRKEVEAMKAQVQQIARATEEEITARGKLAQKLELIRQYEAMTPQDWDALEQQDPLGSNTHFRQYQLAMKEAQNLSYEIQQRAQQRIAFDQQETAKRIATSRDEASKKLKGWSPQAEEKAFTWAVNEKGVPPQVLAQIMSPEAYEMVYLAYYGHQALNRPAKPKAAPVDGQPQPTQAQPITRLSGKNAAPQRGLHDNLSIEEWTKRRNAQLKGG